VFKQGDFVYCRKIAVVWSTIKSLFLVWKLKSFTVFGKIGGVIYTTAI